MALAIGLASLLLLTPLAFVNSAGAANVNETSGAGGRGQDGDGNVPNAGDKDGKNGTANGGRGADGSAAGT